MKNTDDLDLLCGWSIENQVLPEAPYGPNSEFSQSRVFCVPSVYDFGLRGQKIQCLVRYLKKAIRSSQTILREIVGGFYQVLRGISARHAQPQFAVAVPSRASPQFLTRTQIGDAHAIWPSFWTTRT